MESFEQCALCDSAIGPGAGFVVRIDVFADPEIPPMTADQIAQTNLDQTLAEVIEQAKHMSPDELQNGVHRRFEYRLCPVCHRRFLTNPLGMPRVTRQGKN
ncbi:MAG TPA: hypothetical protein VK797_11305 [Tepidisphaeraceae bacterium]|nr:hypothetical protein [Tepidisphaeraceae bacterium]